MQSLLEIARAAAVKKSFMDVEPAIDRLEEESFTKNFYDDLRYPGSKSIFSMLRVVNKAMRAETQRSTATCAIALKRYSLRNGKLPASLDALVPEFLPSVPIDYMDGKPMKYHLNTDGTFTLYSIGEDGKDGGGDASLPPGKEKSRNLWSRRDVVWPAPALPEELEACRTEALKN